MNDDTQTREILIHLLYWHPESVYRRKYINPIPKEWEGFIAVIGNYRYRIGSAIESELDGDG